MIINSNTRYEILYMLAKKNKGVFFRVAHTNDDITFNNPNYVWYGVGLILKDEFVDEIEKLSTHEIITIFDGANSSSDIKKIKNWIVFFGVITIIGLILTGLFIVPLI